MHHSTVAWFGVQPLGLGYDLYGSLDAIFVRLVAKYISKMFDVRRVNYKRYHDA